MSSSRQQGNDRFPDYVTVAERLKDFYETYPTGRVVTRIVEHDPEKGFVLMAAALYRQPDEAEPAATGHASEVRGDGFVNKNYYVENCETSAVGRALSNLAFEARRTGELRAMPPATTTTPRSPAAGCEAGSPPRRVAAGSSDAELRQAHERVSYLRGKLIEENRVTQPELDRRLAAHGAKTVNELPLDSARLHIEELSELYNNSGRTARRA